MVHGVGLLDLGHNGESLFPRHCKVLRKGDKSILPVVVGISPRIGLQIKDDYTSQTSQEIGTYEATFYGIIFGSSVYALLYDLAAIALHACAFSFMTWHSNLFSEQSPDLTEGEVNGVDIGDVSFVVPINVGISVIHVVSGGAVGEIFLCIAHFANPRFVGAN